MSYRTLLEINHDFHTQLADDQFLRTLRRYLASASLVDAKALEGFGVRIIAMRHHSEPYQFSGPVDGFPATYPEKHE